MKKNKKPFQTFGTTAIFFPVPRQRALCHALLIHFGKGERSVSIQAHGKLSCGHCARVTFFLFIHAATSVFFARKDVPAST
jgi:hypothetical protein